MANTRLTSLDLLQRARSMRHNPAPAEEILWSMLRNRQLAGFKFRRQTPIPPFIADFSCAQARLIIELDGDSHASRAEYDGKRSTRLERDGFTILRFLNADIFENLDAVLEEILRECEQPAARNHPHPNPLPAYREREPDGHLP